MSENLLSRLLRGDEFTHLEMVQGLRVVLPGERTNDQLVELAYQMVDSSLDLGQLQDRRVEHEAKTVYVQSWLN